MTSFDRCKARSEKTLNELISAISMIVPQDTIVLTCGSYARREATNGSDIDYFIVSSEKGAATAIKNESKNMQWVEKLEATIKEIVPLEPSTGGPFAKFEDRKSMLENIGGENDTNHKITRRMLLLLEGEALFNREGLERLRHDILERYIGEKITDHQLALFLLNDIIRYYRTVTTDYEFKTIEGGKPWGIRNIKLVFSRKLLYASGLFSVATTADRVRARKISSLETLFNMPVIDRIIDICGELNFRDVLKSYNYFLEKMESQEIREHLKGLGPKDRKDPIFRDLKNEGHHFTREILKLFENTFDSTHPIWRAVIF